MFPATYNSYYSRCSTYNSLAATTNNCINCGEKFVYSFVSFELLPLIEFQLENDISHEEAVKLIETPAVEKKDGKWKEEITENQQTLQIQTLEEEEEEKDPFAFKVSRGEKKTFRPVVVDRKTLLSLDVSSILICKWPSPLKYRFFKNILPDLHIVMCESCFKCYHVDDFELQLLQNGSCPFCRCSPDSVDQNTSDEFVS